MIFSTRPFYWTRNGVEFKFTLLMVKDNHLMVSCRLRFPSREVAKFDGTFLDLLDYLNDHGACRAYHNLFNDDFVTKAVDFQIKERIELFLMALKN